MAHLPLKTPDKSEIQASFKGHLTPETPEKAETVENWQNQPPPPPQINTCESAHWENVL